MWLQATVIGASFVLGAVAYVYSQYNRHFRNEQCFEAIQNTDPNIDSANKLGPCCHCRGSVNIENGYKIPCQHVVHYTCAASLKLRFGFGFDWILEGCRDCLIRHENLERMRDKRSYNK